MDKGTNMTEVMVTRKRPELQDLADAINAEHEACLAGVYDGAKHAWEAGKRLKEAKGQLSHGEWLPWVKKNVLFSEDTAQRYVKLFCKYPKGLPNTAGLRYLRLIAEPDAHVSHNSGENEWYTPAEYADRARLTMGGIDLDPASTDEANTIVKAEQIFTIGDDGLSAERTWAGRVFMNPPYAQPYVRQFCDRLVAEFRDGNVTQAVVLVNNATETQWFQSLVRVSHSVCFPLGRVRYWEPGGKVSAPLQGQAVIYLGERVISFAKQFKDLGAICVPT